MKRQKVESSNIASIGYAPEKKTLEVEFHSGQIYQYCPVTVDFYKQLMNAPSKGTFFVKNLRNATGIKATLL